MTPPDPVRPVAPREDELEALKRAHALLNKHQIDWLTHHGVEQTDEYLAWMAERKNVLRLIENTLRLAAAPVPCAASPADQRFDELLADLRTVESIYQKDRVAHVYASTIEKIFDKWLYDDEPDSPRATGEGARDGIEDRSERVDSVGRGGDAANADGPADRGGDDRRGASDRGAEGQASPVAVSLDPHRLLLEEILQRIESSYRGSIGGIENTYLSQIGVDEVQRWRARLRGEATRPESSQMNLPDIEVVSAAVHDTWMATKHRQGVTSRKSESGEELMAPYADLSEAAKELDRCTVRAVYAAIEASATVQVGE